jgi:hypothetical protein
MRRDFGANRLRASAQGHGERLLRVEPGATAAGVVDVGDVVLPPAGAIGGTVADSDGSPRPDCLVRLRNVGGERSLPLAFAVRTDGRARFLFPDLGPGRWRAETEDGAAAEVDLAAGQRVLDLVLRPPEGGALAVRVVDDAGAPVPAARVSVLDAELRVLGNGEADPEGRARFSGLPEGELSLSAWPPWSRRGYLPATSDPVVADGREVVVTMERAPLLAGVVLDPAGNRLTGIQVVVLSSADGTALLGDVTNASGHFEIPVPAGSVVDVIVTGQRMAPSGDVERLPYVARVGNVRLPSEPLTIRTEEIALDRELVVRVLDPGGGPFADARVTVVSDAGQMGGIRGETETVRFTQLPDREVEVRAIPYGSAFLAPEPVRVVPAGQEIVVHLRRGVPITGIVRRADGEPAPGASVTVTADGRALAGAIADDEGRFAVPGPEGKPVRLRARAESRRGVVEGVIAGGPPIEVVLGVR